MIFEQTKVPSGTFVICIFLYFQLQYIIKQLDTAVNDQQREILLITQEECAEVTQAISKCFRFGLDQYKPGKPKTNREHLAEELGDLMAMIKLCQSSGLITENDLNRAMAAKLDKLRQWSNIFNQGKSNENSTNSG